MHYRLNKDKYMRRITEATFRPCLHQSMCWSKKLHPEVWNDLVTIWHSPGNRGTCSKAEERVKVTNYQNTTDETKIVALVIGLKSGKSIVIGNQIILMWMKALSTCEFRRTREMRRSKFPVKE